MSRSWMPHVVELVGGELLLADSDSATAETSYDELVALDPDIVVLQSTKTDLEVLEHVVPWSTWGAVSAGRVFVCDFDFESHGPTRVIEMVAAVVHGDSLPDLLDSSQGALRCVSPELELVDASESLFRNGRH
ncbi:MAG: hypothetical protein AAF196_05635 [Planctomycetota bacterium]